MNLLSRTVGMTAMSPQIIEASPDIPKLCYWVCVIYKKSSSIGLLSKMRYAIIGRVSINSMSRYKKY